MIKRYALLFHCCSEYSRPAIMQESPQAFWVVLPAQRGTSREQLININGVRETLNLLLVGSSNSANVWKLMLNAGRLIEEPHLFYKWFVHQDLSVLCHRGKPSREVYVFAINIAGSL